MSEFLAIIARFISFLIGLVFNFFSLIYGLAAYRGDGPFTQSVFLLMLAIGFYLVAIVGPYRRHIDQS